MAAFLRGDTPPLIRVRQIPHTQSIPHRVPPPRDRKLPIGQDSRALPHPTPKKSERRREKEGEDPLSYTLFPLITRRTFLGFEYPLKYQSLREKHSIILILDFRNS